jgi:hypothetical protein
LVSHRMRLVEALLCGTYLLFSSTSQLGLLSLGTITLQLTPTVMDPALDAAAAHVGASSDFPEFLLIDELSRLSPPVKSVMLKQHSPLLS